MNISLESILLVVLVLIHCAIIVFGIMYLLNKALQQEIKNAKEEQPWRKR